MRKLPARHAAWVTPLLLTLFMTCIVSFISTFKGVGFGPRFVEVWLSAWRWSWVVAFPAMLMVLPVAKRLTAAVVHVRSA